MTGSVLMMALGNASSMLLSGANGSGENRPLITPTRLCFTTQQTQFSPSSRNGAASQRKQLKESRGLKAQRFRSKGMTTSVFELKCLRTEWRPVSCASGLGDKGLSLNRNDVVELLSEAVHTLLKPEHQKRLRERLVKNRQRIHQHQSEVLDQPPIVNEWSSLATTIPLQDLEEVRHLELEGDSVDSGKCFSDEISEMRSMAIPLPSQVTELVEQDGQPRSIETVQSSTGSVEDKEDNSLTSIRRLKVLNVHSYVHNALRASALRSWLNSRTIED